VGALPQGTRNVLTDHPPLDMIGWLRSATSEGCNEVLFTMLLVVIGVLWVIALAPPLVRSFRDGRPGDSITSFQRQLHTLQRTAPVQTSVRPMVRTGRPAVAPATLRQRNLARQRRRQIFICLAGIAVLTAALAIAAGGMFVWIHLAVDAALVVWVVAVVQTQRTMTQQYQPIRYQRAA
jgi:hypothetical protein